MSVQEDIGRLIAKEIYDMHRWQAERATEIALDHLRSLPMADFLALRGIDADQWQVAPRATALEEAAHLVEAWADRQWPATRTILRALAAEIRGLKHAATPALALCAAALRAIADTREAGDG